MRRSQQINQISETSLLIWFEINIKNLFLDGAFFLLVENC